MTLKFGFNTRLVRCEYCGKWGLVRRLSLTELRAAEAGELAAAQPASPTEEKDLIDKSRFV